MRLEAIVASAGPLLLHLVIVASVFDIYFKSPLVSVPEPEKPEVCKIVCYHYKKIEILLVEI